MHKARAGNEERRPFFDALDDVPPESIQFCGNYSSLRNACPRPKGLGGRDGGSQGMSGGGRVLGGYLARCEEVQRAVVGFDEHCEGGDHEDQSQRYRGWKYGPTFISIEPISPTRALEFEAGVEAGEGREEECPS